MRILKAALLLIAAFWLVPAIAQSATASDMQILLDKIKADKKLVVAANLGLTEAEAKGFWPVYEAYQKDLETLNRRTAAAVKSYADAWNANTMNDELAMKLTDDYLSILADEVKHMQSYVPKLNEVLPATKVARYLQIENKIRAIIKYELAAEVPLMPGN